jgi:hypothetical protein
MPVADLPEGLSDRLEIFAGQRLRQINITDLGHEIRRHWNDGNSHFLLLRKKHRGNEFLLFAPRNRDSNIHATAPEPKPIFRIMALASVVHG